MSYPPSYLGYPPGYPGAVPCPPVPALISWLQHFGVQIDTFERVVEAEAQPFATVWVPAEEVFRVERAELIPTPNAIIHPGNSPNAERYDDRNLRFSLVIQPSEFIYDPDNPPPTPGPAGPGIPSGVFNPYAAALNFGMPTSMLKARITLALGYSKEIFFDIDIGAGVLIPLETRWVNKVEVLIPDPNSVPALPDPVPPRRRLATMFRSRIICCDCVPPVPILSPKCCNQLMGDVPEGCCFRAATGKLVCPGNPAMDGTDAAVVANFTGPDGSPWVSVAWPGGGARMPVCDEPCPGLCCVNVDTSTWVCPEDLNKNGTPANIAQVIEDGTFRWAIVDGVRVPVCGTSCPPPQLCPRCPAGLWLSPMGECCEFPPEPCCDSCAHGGPCTGCSDEHPPVTMANPPQRGTACGPGMPKCPPGQVCQGGVCVDLGLSAQQTRQGMFSRRGR